MMSDESAAQLTREKPTYIDAVNALTDRFPILFYVSDFVKRHIGQPAYPVRAAVLEFTEGKVRKIDFGGKGRESSYNKLHAYLSSTSSDCQHRLYIIEDLDAAFIELLGAYLNVDGTVFGSQIRDTHFSGGWEHGHQPQLPSFQDPGASFTLRYYEARYFDDGSLPDFSASMRTSGNLSRRILLGKGRRNKISGNVGLLRTRNYDGQIGLIRRNASFWSRVETNGSWNGTILVDPPVQGIIRNSTSGPLVTHVPSYSYQGGYRDFTKWPASLDSVLPNIRGPHRISLFDDISYYWTEVATSAEISLALTNPYNSTLFLRNIIASTWMNTNEYIQAILSELETKLWEIERMISPELSHAEKDSYMDDFTIALNEVNTMRRRLTWFINEMKVNCEALGTSADLPDRSKQSGDFVAIYDRLVSYQNWAERLMNVITTSVNLMEMEKSLADSKSLARLTVLGFFFIPLSFIGTIFSMGGEFLVGQSKFWIYFAVSVPLNFSVFALAFGKWRKWWKDLMFRVIKTKRE